MSRTHTLERKAEAILLSVVDSIFEDAIAYLIISKTAVPIETLAA